MSTEKKPDLQKSIYVSIQQNKYKKAMKDLDTLMMYAPDNMQVAALKI